MTDETALDAEAVQRRLEVIQERLGELGGLGEVTARRLRDDWLVRAAVERVLTQLVELAVQTNTHIGTAAGKLAPSTYRESFGVAAEVGALPAALAARLAPSAGLRNILVHQYLDADLTIVADSVAMVIKDYGEYVREVAGWLGRRSDPESGRSGS